MLPFRWPRRFEKFKWSRWLNNTLTRLGSPARGYKAIMILWIGILRKHWNSTRSSSESQLAALGNKCFLWSQLNPFRPCNTPVQPSMAVTLNCQGMFTRLTLDIRGNDNFQKRTFAEIVAFPCWSIWVNLFGSHNFAPIKSLTPWLQPCLSIRCKASVWTCNGNRFISPSFETKLLVSFNRPIPLKIYQSISVPHNGRDDDGWRIWNPWYLWRHQPPVADVALKIGDPPVPFFQALWNSMIWVSNFETLSSL